MSLYLPKDFADKRIEIAFDLMEKNNFACLYAQGKGEVQFSHLPFLLDRNVAPCGRLFAHMARANPQWKGFKEHPEVRVIFQGPHAYISPRWYMPDPGNVPTWNYAVVHAYGRVSLITDEHEAYELMQRLVAQHDPEWVLDLSDADRRELIAGIVVFAIDLTRVEGKYKLSQNRTDDDQLSVIRHLQESPWESERLTAEMMTELRGMKNPPKSGISGEERG